mgnify:CR=1 FL=1
MTSSASARVLARILIGLLALAAIAVVWATAALADDTAAPATTTVLDPPEKAGVGVVDSETGQWWLRDPVTGESTRFYYGNPGDVPFMGDWNCDGVDTPGLYRQSDGYVYLRNSNTQGVADLKFFFGNPGDIPLTGNDPDLKESYLTI